MTFATLTGLLNDMQTNPPLNFLGRLKSDQDKVLQRKSGAVSKSGGLLVIYTTNFPLSEDLRTLKS